MSNSPRYSGRLTPDVESAQGRGQAHARGTVAKEVKVARAQEVTATSLGSWPGTDPVEAAKVSLGLFPSPHLPSLAELPARGIGSDPVGRTAGLLVELPVDVQPYGWRFADRPGNDHRRAVSALSTDINVLADVAGGSELLPSALKLHIVGPISLASAIHLHYGERALLDFGARRDIAQSLAAGLVVLVEKVRAAVPGAELTLQIDEPEVARALAGTVPTISGYRTLRSVPISELRQSWTDLVAAARKAGFSEVAINLAQLPDPAQVTEPAEVTSWRNALKVALECGIDAVALPLNQLDTGHWEQLAEAIESGIGVWAGTVPLSSGQASAQYSSLVERIVRPWQSLGLEAGSLNLLRVTPEAGLSSVVPQQARDVVNRTLEVAAALTELRNA